MLQKIKISKGVKRIGLFGWMILIIYSHILPAAVAGEKFDLPQPDAKNGERLVQALCVSCHVVPGTVQNAVPVGIPTFREIANRDGQTAQNIFAALILPHYPMPDMHFTNKEMRDVVAYIDTLRADNGAPPLLPEVKKKKSKSDKPSPS